MTEHDLLVKAVQERWNVRAWLAFVQDLQTQIQERDDTIKELKAQLYQARRTHARLRRMGRGEMMIRTWTVDEAAKPAWEIRAQRARKGRKTMTDELPALRPGKVWGIRVYPGGRHELRQCDPKELLSVDEAVVCLLERHRVYVAPGDIQAVFDWRQTWQRGERRTRQPLQPVRRCRLCTAPLSRHNESGICIFCTEHPERRG